MKFFQDSLFFFITERCLFIKVLLISANFHTPIFIVQNNLQNKGISKGNELEAWLTFLSVDNPKWILKLIETHPKFKKLYLEIYEACRNTEVFMGLFSKELLELDQNTVDFMIDEMQDIIDAQKLQIEEQQLKLEEQQLLIEQLKKQLEEK